MKQCTSCNIKKPLSEFGIQSKNKDGRTAKCAICLKEYNKKYRQENKDKIAQHKKKKYAENRNDILAQKKKYYEANIEKIKAKNDSYRKNNKEKIAEKQVEYRKANKEKLNKYAEEYRKTSKYKFQSKTYKKQRLSKIKATCDGTITKGSLEELYEVQNHQCFYCNTFLDELDSYYVHLDHYIPLSKGGIHSIGNVVWSCKDCNQKKER